MSSRSVYLWLTAAALLSASACGPSSPEGFCERWAANRCEVLAGCCGSGEKFDEQDCRVGQSKSCQDDVEVEKVHAGELVFDSGAASDCLGSISSCTDADATPNPDSFEQRKACANMLTGFRPPGAACSEARECRQTRAYATCYGGMCVEVVLDTSCGFSFDSGELRVCPDGKHCDTSAFEPSPNDPPSTRMHAFTGNCVDAIPLGGACGPKLPCAEGLYCDTTNDTGDSGDWGGTCAAQKPSGAPCFYDGNECAAGLSCASDESDFYDSCQPNQASTFSCYKPG